MLKTTKTLLVSASVASLTVALGGVTPAAAQGMMDDVTLGGFVTSSFFYNFNRPMSDENTGRTFDSKHGQFMINKFKLELEKAVEASSDSWAAGFRADVTLGQDAGILQSNGLDLGGDGDLTQAYVQINAPVGNGLQITAGKMSTLMGFEVLEEVANPNWSVANQFLFVENFTTTGIDFSYQWNDVIDTQFRIYNGWDVVDDNNGGVSFMARIGIAASETTAIGILGYTGPEQDGDTSAYRTGAQVLVEQAFSEKLTVWFQGDYGYEEANAALPVPTESAEWWGAGLWIDYKVNDQVGFAIRGDWVDDKDGSRITGIPGGSEMSSLTFTLNLTPIDGLQIRPEVRWDHSNVDFFEDKNGNFVKGNQVTLGMGAAYIF